MAEKAVFRQPHRLRIAHHFRPIRVPPAVVLLQLGIRRKRLQRFLLKFIRLIFRIPRMQRRRAELHALRLRIGARHAPGHHHRNLFQIFELVVWRIQFHIRREKSSRRARHAVGLAQLVDEGIFRLLVDPMLRDKQADQPGRGQGNRNQAANFRGQTELTEHEDASVAMILVLVFYRRKARCLEGRPSTQGRDGNSLESRIRASSATGLGSRS